MKSKRLLPLAAKVLGAFTLFMVVGGLLHTPYGRPLLQRLGGCPIGSVRAADAERLHRAANAAGDVTRHAPVLPSPIFSLGITERADVQRWSEQWNVTCRNKLEGHLLLCAQVPAPALARSGVPVEEVELSFGVEDGKLYAVSLFSRTSADGAAIASATTWLERALGAPDLRIGSPSGKATFTQEYHFANYTSQITATPLGERIAVREHYALVGGRSR